MLQESIKKPAIPEKIVPVNPAFVVGINPNFVTSE
jgi:hypothetical protein